MRTIAACLVLVACTASTNEREAVVTAEIQGGDAESGHLAVGWLGPLGCTGTLITPTVVLTAGHCLERRVETFTLNIDGGVG